jgi:hypothetical protein
MLVRIEIERANGRHHITHAKFKAYGVSRRSSSVRRLGYPRTKLPAVNRGGVGARSLNVELQTEIETERIGQDRQRVGAVTVIAHSKLQL